MSSAPILTISRDGEILKTYSLEGEVILGRAAGCAIRLDDRAVSREHAVFRVSSEGVEVQQKSEFASFLINGQVSSGSLLHHGDIVLIGPYSLTLSLTAQPTSEKRALDSPKDGPYQKSVSQISDWSENRISKSVESASLQTPQSEEIPSLEMGSFSILESNEVGENTSMIPESLVETHSKTRMKPPGKVNVQLSFPEGAANYLKFKIDLDGEKQSEQIILGRDRSCDIVLNDKKSSRRNTVIHREGMRFTIEDLGSSNGTYVNGVKIEKQDLTGDDQIRIGDVEFEFKILSTEYFAEEKDFLPVESSPEVPSEEAEDLNALNDFAPIEPGAFQIPFAPPRLLEPQQRLIRKNFTPSVLGGAQVSSGTAAAAGIGEAPPQPQPKTLLGKGIAKLNSMPPKRRAVWLVIIILGMAFLIFDEEQSPVAKKIRKKSTVVTATPSGSPSPGVMKSFESLSADQKAFVEEQHRLAFDYFKNQEFDKALYELGKIFAITSDYKDARDIERYAKEGKRRLEAKEEENRRKTEETRLKAKIEELENEARQKMAKKQYDQAREIFPQIHLLDPENELVQKWTQEIEEAAQEDRLAQQKEEVRKEINHQAWEIYRAALKLKKQGKCHLAIASWSKINELDPSDSQVKKNSKAMISQCRAEIRAAVDPLLSEGKELETQGEFAKAFDAFRKASGVDPKNSEAFAGMDRIRGILHDRAKVMYTEAVLAESYSDFVTAKKKFNEILKTTPKEDLYYQRSQRKIGRYFDFKEESE